MDKIIGVYKITNTVTGDTYIGSSINVKRRWKVHKNPSTWKLYPSNKMYKDFASYGLDKFTFSVLYQCCRPLLRFMEQLSINCQAIIGCGHMEKIQKGTNPTKKITSKHTITEIVFMKERPIHFIH